MLDPIYRARALPAGSARHWSWLFAPPAARGPLLGTFALLAEWRALMDPATEPAVAATALAWWQDEVQRLNEGRPAHPIGRFLRTLPGADATDFAPLAGAVAAAQIEVMGVPVERAADLEEHADALYGRPLGVAAAMTAAALGTAPAGAPLAACTRALGAADYLAHALSGYSRAAGRGRTPFAVDELLAAGIETADLQAAQPPAPLAAYLADVRARCVAYYRGAAAVLPAPLAAAQRALLVLADLGARRALQPGADGRLAGPADLFHAWAAARRATQFSRTQAE